MRHSRLLHAIELDDATQEDTEELAALLRDANDMIVRCQALRADIELELAARMEADTLPVPGVGMLTRTEERTSKWRESDSGARLREDLREAIAKRLAVNVRTGELDDMTRNVVRLAIDAAYEVIPAFSTIKKAGYRLGLDMDDYREFATHYRVTLIPEGATADD